MSISARIKQARLRRGLSLRAAAQRAGISHAAINKYEKGDLTPDSQRLIRLARALEVEPSYFLRPVVVGEIELASHRRASLEKKAQRQIIEEVRDWLERYLTLLAIAEEEDLEFCFPQGFPMTVRSLDEAEGAAEALRRAWNAGSGPIKNLSDLLEQHHILHVAVASPVLRGALTFRVDGTLPVMVTRRGLPGDRQRFALAHELGRLMIRVQGLDEEKVYQRFAVALLAPAGMLLRDLGQRRHTLSTEELHLLKHRYGLNMQALIRRAHDVGILDAAAYRRHHNECHRQGWPELEPGRPVPGERPVRFELLVRRCVSEGLITPRRAAELFGRSLPALV